MITPSERVVQDVDLAEILPAAGPRPPCPHAARRALPDQRSRATLAYTLGIAFSTARPSFTSTLKSTDFALKRVMSSGTCFATLLATAS